MRRGSVQRHGETETANALKKSGGLHTAQLVALRNKQLTFGLTLCAPLQSTQMSFQVFKGMSYFFVVGLTEDLNRQCMADCTFRLSITWQTQAPVRWAAEWDHRFLTFTCCAVLFGGSAKFPAMPAAQLPWRKPMHRQCTLLC